MKTVDVKEKAKWKEKLGKDENLRRKGEGELGEGETRER